MTAEGSTEPRHPARHAPSWRQTTFASLANRNYRIFMSGQVVSMAGTFMQAVAQAWLVVKLTDSGTALGFLLALQFLPLLFLGGPAGVLIDRSDRRNLYVITQSIGAASALALGLLVSTGAVTIGIVYAFAFLFGIVNCVDQPTRQAITYDLVGPEHVQNAVSLTMSVNNTAKVVGPALAGLVIGKFGIATCFYINAASFLVVITALLLLRRDEMAIAHRQAAAKGQVREGLAYVRRTPELLGALMIAAITFGFGWQFEVLLPLLAKRTFHGDATTFGSMSAAIAIGSTIGALAMAGRAVVNGSTLITAVVFLAVATMLAAVAPWYGAELVVLVLAGVAGISVAAVCSTLVQLLAAPNMRGRVVSLYIIAIQGLRPIGGPLAGFTAERLGVRWCLFATAPLLLALALPTWWLLLRPKPLT